MKHETADEFMQVLCEFKGFARSNILFLSPAKYACLEERLELPRKIKLDKVPQIGASDHSRVVKSSIN